MSKVFELKPDHKVYIAGHRGMVGSAIWRALEARGHSNLVGRSSAELDLRERDTVRDFFAIEKPDVVFVAAAKVGGILANDSYPVDFLTDNLRIQLNVIDEAYKNGVKRLLFLGSSCIYPKFAPQPIKEEYLLTGELEPTNEAYAIAKIAGIKQVQAYRKQYGASFISAMPTNLYGPGDNYNPTTSHVIPALLSKFYNAVTNKLQSIEVWGDGTVSREFLHVDDLAAASLFILEHYDSDNLINVGVGKDIRISDLVILLKKITGFEGVIKFDATKPNGTPRKLMAVEKLMTLGWQAEISLEEGLMSTYRQQFQVNI